ncbi:hypothetical protein I316_04392 [Kwoniella heveanensis BCC8398]|uniref:Uncharacterized protein n=1 Tax=Kwoniella heveanensis BCC8398 TaxID=1296120 RepID=A0A1B9GT51_9TREE|nr:hypothetical protein I316_04392 [Kwoniella heveanensis BCC8398]
MSASTDNSLYAGGSDDADVGPTMASQANSDPPPGPGTSSATPPIAAPAETSTTFHIGTPAPSVEATTTITPVAGASNATSVPVPPQPGLTAGSTHSLSIHVATPPPGSPTADGPATSVHSHDFGAQGATASPDSGSSSSPTALAAQTTASTGTGTQTHPLNIQQTSHAQSEHRRHCCLLPMPRDLEVTLMRAASIGLAGTIIILGWRLDGSFKEHNITMHELAQLKANMSSASKCAEEVTATKTEWVIPATVIPSDVRTALARHQQEQQEQTETSERAHDPDLTTDASVISGFITKYLNGDPPRTTVTTATADNGGPTTTGAAGTPATEFEDLYVTGTATGSQSHAGAPWI